MIKPIKDHRELGQADIQRELTLLKKRIPPVKGWIAAFVFGPEGGLAVAHGDQNAQLAYLKTVAADLDRRHMGGETPSHRLLEIASPVPIGRWAQRQRSAGEKLLYELGARNRAGLVSGLIAVANTREGLTMATAGVIHAPGFFSEFVRVLSAPSRGYDRERWFRSEGLDVPKADSGSLAAHFARAEHDGAHTKADDAAE